MSRRDWVDSRRLARAPDIPTSSLLVERSSTVSIGQRCRRRWLEYGTMYGIVEEGAGPLPDGGFAKYRVRWDGRIDDWYARKQCLDTSLVMGDQREDFVPAVVVPASSAHFEGGELLLYAMARKGCTIWHRLARRPFFSSTRRRGDVLLSTRRRGSAPRHAVDAMTLLTPSTRRGDGVFYATRRHRRHRREDADDAGTGKLDPSTSRARRCAYSRCATATATS